MGGGNPAGSGGKVSLGRDAMKRELLREDRGYRIYVEEIRPGEWEAFTLCLPTSEDSAFVPPRVRVPGGPFRTRQEAGDRAIQSLGKQG